MKRIYNQDIKIAVSDLPLVDTFFDITFYTISPAVNFTKNQDDVDDLGFIALDYSLLSLLGEGILSYTLTNHVYDPELPDQSFDTSITRATNYYIMTDVEPVPPEESGQVVTILTQMIEEEGRNRIAADEALDDRIDSVSDRVSDLESIDFNSLVTDGEMSDAIGAALQEAKEYTDTMTSSITVDLTDYYTSAQTDSLLVQKANQSDLSTLSSSTVDIVNAVNSHTIQIAHLQDDFDNYYTSAQTDSLLAQKASQSDLSTLSSVTASKQDKLTAGTGIEITSGNTINCTLDIYPFVVLQSYEQVEPFLAHYGDRGKIALVPNSSTTQNNIYDEYIWVVDPSIVPAGGRVEKLGEYQSDVDLTDYYTSAQTDNLLAQKQPVGNYVSASTLNDYYTSGQTDTLLAGKQAAGNYVSASTLNDYYTSGQTDTLLAGKQAIGNYVSASTLNDYYTSAQTDTLLAGKQAAGNYVSASTLSNYYTSAQTDQAIEEAVSEVQENNIIELTQAEYDALVDVDETALYIITDAPNFDPANYYTSAQTDTMMQKVVKGYDQAYTIRVMTQTDYNALSTKDANTIYIIQGS